MRRLIKTPARDPLYFSISLLGTEVVRRQGRRVPYESIRFSKYTGAGNDFVVVDDGAARITAPDALARRLCPRTTGAGVDGLILVRNLGVDRLHVRFFNPDGSEYSTCGNGSRCAAQFAADQGLATGTRLQLCTASGEVEARLNAGSVALDYRMEVWVEREVVVEFNGARRSGWLVQIGTPHFVLPVNSSRELESVTRERFEARCRPLRNHPSLAPAGANINLVAPVSSEQVMIRTFERGVEGETLACGSGAMATVLAMHAHGRCSRSVALLTRSGDALEVKLWPEDQEIDPADTRCDHIRLRGPARPLFEGTFPARRASRG